MVKHKITDIGDDDYIELTMSSSLYSEPDKQGKQKLIKKNIITKISIYIDDIQGHEEIFNSKGEVMNTTCRIYHKNLGPLIIKRSYKQISEIKHRSHEPVKVEGIGFLAHKNK